MVNSQTTLPATLDPEDATLIELPMPGLVNALTSLEMPEALAALDPGDEEHTPEHGPGCPACSGANRALQGIDVNLAALTFPEAAAYWMRLRRQSLSFHARTHEATEFYLSSLQKFFFALRLGEITPGHLRGYQLARAHNLVRSAGRELHPWKIPAGHSTINHELSVVAQILRHAKLWHRVQPYYFPLSVAQWSPRTVLTEEEEERLFDIASRHPEASLAYWIACITNNTTASGIELRLLRLKHLFLLTEGIAEIYIPPDAVKNNSRPRKIALNPTARWAVGECYKRALHLGATDPDHYLFPFCVHRHNYDPTRPAARGFLRKSWDKLRKATSFHELAPHDLRHHCITRLLENDVAPETVRAIAGHVTAKMMEYYAHQRTRVKYAAVMAIDKKKIAPAPRTNGPYRLP